MFSFLSDTALLRNVLLFRSKVLNVQNNPFSCYGRERHVAERFRENGPFIMTLLERVARLFAITIINGRFYCDVAIRSFAYRSTYHDRLPNATAVVHEEYTMTSRPSLISGSSCCRYPGTRAASDKIKKRDDDDDDGRGSGLSERRWCRS